MKENVRVVVRIRPSNKTEIESERSRLIINTTGENVLTFDPNDAEQEDFYHGKARKHRDLTKRIRKDMAFAFDRVFDQSSTNDQVYLGTTKSILDSFLSGYNCSVFAYGATGSGKTYSMLGSEQQKGIIFQTMVDLYSRIDAMKDDKICEVKVSYLEVYNEQIRDLLPADTGASTNRVLPIREDPKLGVVVKGLSVHSPKSAEELLHMLHFGNQNRTQHPTDANAESSRSHAVFQVFVRMKPRTAGVSMNIQLAKMSLIDLAGSERATVTKNHGDRLREGANINCSLLALGNVINALADSKVKANHIPYRDSKLTRLLKDSLGVNCHTVMIATVSPSSLSYEDTYNTLKYADRAKRIKTQLKKNVVNVDSHIGKYMKIIEDLRTEVGELKQKLASSSLKTETETSLVPDNRYKLNDMKDVLYEVFMSRIGIQKEILEFEAVKQDLKWRMNCKQIHVERANLIPLHIQDSREISKIQTSIATMHNRVSAMEKRQLLVQDRLSDNHAWLAKVEGDMDKMSSIGVPEVLSDRLRMHHLEVELMGSRRHVKHLKKLLRSYDRERRNQESLVRLLLQTVTHQHSVLSWHAWVTSDLDARYKDILGQSLNAGSVAWADQQLDVSQSNLIVDDLLELPIISCVKTSPIAPVNSKKGIKPELPKPYEDNVASCQEKHVGQGDKNIERVAERQSFEHAGHTPYHKGNDPAAENSSKNKENINPSAPKPARSLVYESNQPLPNQIVNKDNKDDENKIVDVKTCKSEPFSLAEGSKISAKRKLMNERLSDCSIDGVAVLPSPVQNPPHKDDSCEDRTFTQNPTRLPAFLKLNEAFKGSPQLCSDAKSSVITSENLSHERNNNVLSDAGIREQNIMPQMIPSSTVTFNSQSPSNCNIRSTLSPTIKTVSSLSTETGNCPESSHPVIFSPPTDRIIIGNMITSSSLTVTKSKSIVTDDSEVRSCHANHINTAKPFTSPVTISTSNTFGDIAKLDANKCISPPSCIDDVPRSLVFSSMTVVKPPKSSINTNIGSSSSIPVSNSENSVKRPLGISSPTYAEVLKSPVRSPLLPVCLNIPEESRMNEETTHLHDCNKNKRSLSSSSANRPSSKVPRRETFSVKKEPICECPVHRHAKQLRQGIPTISSQISCSYACPRPNYMNMTKTATLKQSLKRYGSSVSNLPRYANENRSMSKMTSTSVLPSSSKRMNQSKFNQLIK